MYAPDHHPDEAFRAAITQGSRAHHWEFGDMAPVGGLSDEEIDLVIAYVRQQQELHGLEPLPAAVRRFTDQRLRTRPSSDRRIHWSQSPMWSPIQSTIWSHHSAPPFVAVGLSAIHRWQVSRIESGSRHIIDPIIIPSWRWPIRPFIQSVMELHHRRQDRRRPW
ncbi:MAG: cytochrome c [Acidimicrobiia bacterium]|nr:cytochrome c [Acidimicrobiia bacterium]